MVDQELLQAIGEVIDKKLEPINDRLDGIDKRLDSIDEQLEEIKEYAEVTRDGVNTLLAWAEECSDAIKLPLPRIGTVE